MKAPILIMAASPTCAPGWYEVPGASPPRNQDAAWALVVPSLVPLDVGGLLAPGQVAGLAACLPPEGFEPARYQSEPEIVRPLDLTARFFGLWFSWPAISWVNDRHRGAWAPGGADGVGAIGEVDLLHGWAARRCVAVVGRLAPTFGGAL